MIFVDIEVIPVLINQASEGNVELIYAIIGYISDHAKESMDFVYSLEYLIKKLIDPGEDYPADEKPVLIVDEFKHIFSLVSSGKMNTLLKNLDSTYNNEVFAFLKILKQTAYFIIDEVKVVELFKESYQILRNQI